MVERNRTPLSRRIIFALIGILVLVGLAYLVTVPAAPTVSTPAEPLDLEVAPAQGALAPEFTLINLDGDQVSLADLRGHPVLINFWATWCAPCRIEMPHIQDRFERYADQGFVVLAVDFDEPAGQVDAFRDELGLTFDILLDPGADVQELYRNRSYPTTFFVDVQGVIQVQHIGVMTEGQLDENLATIGLES